MVSSSQVFFETPVAHRSGSLGPLKTYIGFAHFFVMQQTGGLFSNWRQDLPASVVVFLVALPLCLSIALASGTNLLSGLIAGIVGGVVVGALSGSAVSVSGPAAGLIVIVKDQVDTIGFEALLAAILLAGLLQILLGVIRAGSLINYVPFSVIRGMLAGIGLTVILKQIPHALGVDEDFFGEMEFIQPGDGRTTFEALFDSFLHVEPTAFAISLVGLGILVFWELDFIKNTRRLKLIPAALLVVVVGTVLNEFAGLIQDTWRLTTAGNHLVDLPRFSSVVSIQRELTSPDFNQLGSMPVLVAAGTIALVASLESLMSVEAVDRLDPLRRSSNLNRELLAQGAGNSISGLLGGLPVTSVIIRSSTNVFAGGRTRLSALLHGVLLLVAVVLIPTLLNRIPLAALAAILLMIGYKLARPKLFRDHWEQGLAQFAPFVVTVVVVVFADLLFGIAAGIIAGFLFVLRTNHQSAFTLVRQGNNYLLRFNKDVSFLHKAELRRKLKKIQFDGDVVISATKAREIDRDIRDVLEDFIADAHRRNITVEVEGLVTPAPPQPSA